MTDGEDGGTEDGENTTADLAVPEEIESWLDDRVDGSDRSAEEELERIVAAHRLAAGFEGSLDPEAVAELDLEAIAALEDRLEGTREEFQRGIEDVRQRVVQVLEETHDRARKDHTHRELEERVDGRIASIESELDALDGRLSEVESTRSDVDANAERILDAEDRLDRFDDRHGEVEGKLDTLASAIVRLRNRVDRLEATDATADRLDALRREANREGVRVADCGQCGRAVTVALLAAPRCPHCEAPFEGVEQSRGFFGSATLVADDRPALEGETAPPSTDGATQTDGTSLTDGATQTDGATPADGTHSTDGSGPTSDGATSSDDEASVVRTEANRGGAVEDESARTDGTADEKRGSSDRE